ncbi:MAG: hypothetical protein H6812_03615 [Phycisphaeraceae bacterium]|nr:hypothetical protein [Phycisphaerales bacterium]MCB9842325.1 hypothetical protein [Phycisphaeraceae bacterium]
MIDEHLDKLRRPGGRPVAEAATPDQIAQSSVAPQWFGPCLRLAGDVQSPAVVFRQRDGKRLALTYSYLSAVRYDPQGVIEIEFVGNQVRVDGVRLYPVFEALVFQRALELVENTNEFDEDGSVPLVKTIVSVSTTEH